MRQRALLAVALACEPRLLIADEPTTALDVTTQAEILALLRDLREKLGMAMLLITHDLGIVASACERLYVIYAGRVVEWGRTKEVFAEPAHPYTVGLFQAARAERDAQGRFATIGGEPPDLGELAQGCPFAPRCAEGDARMRALDAGRIRLGRRRVRTPCAAGFIRRRKTPQPRPIERVEASMAAPLLALQGITHSFRRSGGALVTAVRDVSLKVRPRGNGRARRRNRARANRRLDASRSACCARTPAACLSTAKAFGDMSSRELRRERVAFQPIFQDATASLNPRRTVRELLGQALRQRGAGASGSHKRRAPRECRAAAGPELSRALPA